MHYTQSFNNLPPKLYRTFLCDLQYWRWDTPSNTSSNLWVLILFACDHHKTARRLCFWSKPLAWPANEDSPFALPKPEDVAPNTVSWTKCLSNSFDWHSKNIHDTNECYQFHLWCIGSAILSPLLRNLIKFIFMYNICEHVQMNFNS